MDFNNYKFRCSSLGNLMTGSLGLTDNQGLELSRLEEKESQGKELTPLQVIKKAELINKRDNPELSETTKSYLLEIFIEQVYGRKKDLTNKYLEKGLLCEEDSLQLLSDYKGKFLLKNKERFNNEFITGEPDYVGDIIIDTKSSWDLFTFHKAELTKNYEWQLRGYMALKGIEKAELAYCLVDAPLHLILDEQRRLSYKMGVIDTDTDEAYLEAAEQIEKNLTFSDIPTKEKVKIFEVQRDEKSEKELYERIKLCRDYLNKLYNQIKN